MPQRFLRPGITTSERFNSLDWITQSFYVRLITLVDDYGRYEAHPMLLRGQAFAMRPEVSVKQVSEMKLALKDAGLVLFYLVEGKEYLQVLKWQERARSESRYPSPPDNNCCQMTADDSKCSLPKPSAISHKPSPTAIAEAALLDSVVANEVEDHVQGGTRREAVLPRTIESCRLLAAKAGIPQTEGDKFFHYYESVGWKVGKNPMRSMNGAMGGWASRYRERNGNVAPSKPKLDKFELAVKRDIEKYGQPGSGQI